MAASICCFAESADAAEEVLPAELDAEADDEAEELDDEEEDEEVEVLVVVIRRLILDSYCNC